MQTIDVVPRWSAPHHQNTPRAVAALASPQRAAPSPTTNNGLRLQKQVGRRRWWKIYKVRGGAPNSGERRRRDPPCHNIPQQVHPGPAGAIPEFRPRSSAPTDQTQLPTAWAGGEGWRMVRTR